MRDEVLTGLAQRQKTLSPKYFYDRRGSELFDEICELDEYYLTRTELAIMEAHAAEMATLLGPQCLVFELGSGSSTKTRLLLDHLEALAAYVPIDISHDYLAICAANLAAAYPHVDVLPVCADFTVPFRLPDCGRPVKRNIAYMPGSTIGNFDRAAAEQLLRRLASLCGPDGALLIGVDLEKDPAILERAYNDADGVTAAFNRNVLTHVNRQLDGDFNPDHFAHHAFYNREHCRIEMHLVSRRAQIVRLNGDVIPFRKGETIHTECSHKYTTERFATLAASAGFAVRNVWTDADRLFSVQYLTVAADV